MRLTWMLASIVALALIAGCGGGDDDDGDGDSSGSGDVTSTVESSDGSGGGGGSAEIQPFSMPLPSGVVHESSRTDIGVLLFYPADDYDEIVAFFDEWTDSEPEGYERFEKEDVVGVGWVWLDDSTPQNRTIDVIKDFDGRGDFGTVTWVLVADEKTP